MSLIFYHYTEIILKTITKAQYQQFKQVVDISNPLPPLPHYDFQV